MLIYRNCCQWSVYVSVFQHDNAPTRCTDGTIELLCHKTLFINRDVASQHYSPKSSWLPYLAMVLVWNSSCYTTQWPSVFKAIQFSKKTILTSIRRMNSAFHKVVWWHFRCGGQMHNHLYRIFFSGFRVPKIIKISSFWLSYSRNNRMAFLTRVYTVSGKRCQYILPLTLPNAEQFSKFLQ